MDVDKIRIVLVDDHVMIRQGIRALLSDQEDIEIIGEANDGNSAIDLITKIQPDLVILDVEMPNLDGLETAKLIHSKNINTKILILSMHSEKRYVSELFALGASGYLLKDENIEELVSAIRLIMEGEIYLSRKLVSTVISDYTQRITKARVADITDLTTREREILRLIAEGLTTKKIAEQLNLKFKTVDTHRQGIMRKLDIHNVVDLTKFAIREGVIEL